MTVPRFEHEALAHIHDPELRASLASLGQALMQQKPQLEPAQAPRPPAKVQLPLWPEPVRGTPNSFLRSALFAAIQGKGRRALKHELLGSGGGVTIRFTGWQLDQSDLDVWELAVHLARVHPLGNICHFRANGFLKALERSNGKKDYVWLHDVITRLVACAVEIRRGTKVFTGSLLSSCARDEATGVYKLTLDPDMIKLYGSADWTGIEWEQRQALKGKPLALWLHGFFASHAEPYPYKVETLRELCGSQAKTLYSFRQQLREALNDLTDDAVGALEAWMIDPSDLVHVQRGRGMSDSQRRHVSRSRPRRSRQRTS